MKYARSVSAPVFVAFLLLIVGPVFGHPLGNFSVNQYSHLDAHADGVFIGYVLDIAEVPTFQEVGALDREEMERHLKSQVAKWVRGLQLSIDDETVPLILTMARLTCVPGAGGLPTLRIEADVRAAPVRIRPRTGQILHAAYRDTNFPGRVGWKEIVVTGEEILTSSVPAVDRGTNRLRQYPTDGSIPPAILDAQFTLRAPDSSSRSSSAGRKSPPVTLELSNCIRPGQNAIGQIAETTPGPSDGPRFRSEATAFGALFKQFARGQIDTKVLLVALAGAVLLGAYHALTPGHGKTILAAYFIGSRGTPGQAVVLGLVVTLTHTSGVFLLGLATLFASHYILPEKIYPWLSMLSGVMLLVVGVSLFRRRMLRLRQTGCTSDHSGHHDVQTSGQAPGHLFTSTQADDPHSHDERVSHVHHRHSHPHLSLPETLRARDLITLGITGGLLPCPSALIVMLAAISVGQVAFGLILILAFSMGLAGVLTGGGLLMVYARTLMTQLVERAFGRQAFGRWPVLVHPVLQRLPVFSAAAVALLGLVIVVQTIAFAGFVP